MFKNFARRPTLRMTCPAICFRNFPGEGIARVRDQRRSASRIVRPTRSGRRLLAMVSTSGSSGILIYPFATLGIQTHFPSVSHIPTSSSGELKPKIPSAILFLSIEAPSYFAVRPAGWRLEAFPIVRTISSKVGLFIKHLSHASAFMGPFDHFSQQI